MRSTRCRAVISRYATRPAAQHRVDAGWVALQIDGAATRVIAASARTHGGDDAASASRGDLPGLRCQRRDHAAHADRSAAAARDAGGAIPGNVALAIAIAIGRTALFRIADITAMPRSRGMPAQLSSRRDVRRMFCRLISPGRNIGGFGRRVEKKNRKADSSDYGTKRTSVHQTHPCCSRTQPPRKRAGSVFRAGWKRSAVTVMCWLSGGNGVRSGLSSSMQLAVTRAFSRGGAAVTAA